MDGWARASFDIDGVSNSDFRDVSVDSFRGDEGRSQKTARRGFNSAQVGFGGEEGGERSD